MLEGSSRDGGQPAYVVKQRLNSQISVVENEISSVDSEIEKLQQLRENLATERKELLSQLKSISQTRDSLRSPEQGRKVASGVDYTDSFDWTCAMKARMKSVFEIESFRLCQEAVCNANMDNRDIVCVMPTGGGKSLTYQLPALLTPGCTLVISPLISLITDQIIHLHEAGVEAVMLTGSTTKEQSRDITSRLTKVPGGSQEIKLCYVTPEKIAKSKTFVSVLQKMASAGRLARIVIDEAHCVSQLGHDFRPDYKKLSLLRTLFPRVPILALSATCPPAVLKDLLLVLRLKPVVDGSDAGSEGTVYFSAPLYRKNLHYKVLPKPGSAGAVIQTMTDYIMEYHRADSGIVYCLSKKDAETVAAGIAETSGGKIQTGIYHADVGDKNKERLHKRWRQGQIQVVCATIAFGLGIDMATVRFVLHHSMSKSLDGFYQESGRAGRDGKDADCVLFYRAQDATRLSSLTCGELGGQEKLHDMLRFAQNFSECRKVLFANYFSSSSALSLASWTSSTSGALTPCGHCDNCTRPPETIDCRDVSLDAWQILKVVQQVERQGGRVTLGMLADLIRGAGGGSFGVVGNNRKGKGTAKEKIGLDLDEIAGGKVTLSKDDGETLLVQLILSHHLKEDFHSTSYSINVYVISGPQAMRLTRLSREAVESGAGQRITCTFLKKAGRKAAAKTKRKDAGLQSQLYQSSGPSDFPLNSVPRTKTKKRGRSSSSGKGQEVYDFIVEDDGDVIHMHGEDSSGSHSDNLELEMRRISPTIFKSSNQDDDGDDDYESTWTFTMDDAAPMQKRRRTDNHNAGPGSEDEVVVLSD
ncbi:P-loop containing nucleoside triphosphate hydrolase protein [Gautieria morchelliformis]|nr:P-loop containing nucleoside triphosphate hydrolase protein [Gautieria morchelliformis]